MRKRFAAALAAGIAALAMSIPTVAFAHKGAVPHSTKACSTHKHSGKHHGSGKGHKRGSGKGKKCG